MGLMITTLGLAKVISPASSSEYHPKRSSGAPNCSKTANRIEVTPFLISQAANLLIFTAGGLTRGLPPFIHDQALHPDRPFADPVPQALILTAIVIGFGVLAFALVLVHRTIQSVGTYDLDDMKGTEQ